MTAAVQHLVLVGGGHSHALLLKHWAQRPLPGVHISLISPQRYTPYSGMLPGLIAGHYDFYQTHIDLKKLCEASGATLLFHEVVAINARNKSVTIEDGTDIGFDLLSINSGITPAVPEALRARVVPVKPIARFYPQWQSWLETLKQSDERTSARLAVVGGGAAGVEMALAIQHRLSQTDVSVDVSLNLLHRGDELLEGYSGGVRRKIQTLLSRRNIEVCCNTEVTSEWLDHHRIDRVFWCAQAKPADWLNDTDLPLSARGFIAVNQYLQSLTFPYVFAAGDVADMENGSLPKAGVFAVRQADTLLLNIQASLRGDLLRPYSAQTSFLSLLAGGDKTAVAARVNGFLPAFSGRWVWRWKDRIDRTFMDQF